MFLTKEFLKKVCVHVVVVIGLIPDLAYGAAINLTDQTITEDDGDVVYQSVISTPSGSSYYAGVIHEALFRRPEDVDESKAGLGVLRDLYRLTGGSSETDKQEGYNRDAIMDSHIPGGFNPFLSVESLVLDTTGNYYVFVIDTNEPGGGDGKFISLDDFKVYVGGSSDPVSLAQSEGDLGSLGISVYDMNPGVEDNTVLLDYSLYSGGGQMDLFVFVPVSSFAGLDSTSMVYIYTEFGGYTEASGFDAAGGPEQVSIPDKATSGTVDTGVPPEMIPEPSVWLLFFLGGVMMAGRRRRS